jgi:serine/threonine-protein kinase
MSDPQSSRDADASAELDLSGRRLGNYQLLRRLGRGGMADVYLAEQLSLQRQVAFKVLKRCFGEDEAYVRRFHNEARAAASLVHANIVQIYEVGCIDGVHFIAQEYVAGQNLKQWLTRHGTADAAAAVHIMRQVIAALSRAAQQGIIHRDIKPENIMLAKTGEVKVADFGLARITQQGQAVGLTQVGVTMGTPLYMSPEQVEGRGVDPRSDLYSFGVTCYEMLSGRPPFEGDTPLSVAVQHLRTEPARLEVSRPDLPEGLCRIVHQLLAKKPDERYATATELMRALRAVHVEGLENWSAASEEWDTPELLALSDARSEATLQLDTIMKAQAGIGQRFLAWRLTVPIVVGLLVGGSLAWWSRPNDLLAVNTPTVEKQLTARKQYFYAYRINSVAAWRAVEENFDQSDPENRYYSLLAKQREAEMHRDRANPAAAAQLYRQLAELGDEEPQFCAAGLVGQANLLADAGDKNGLIALLGQEGLPQFRKLTEKQQRETLALLDDKAIALLGSEAGLQGEIEAMRGEAIE